LGVLFLVGGMRKGKDQDRLIEQTLAVWQPLTKRKLGAEDAREIVANIGSFFQILRRWKKAEACCPAGSDKKQPDDHKGSVDRHSRRKTAEGAVNEKRKRSARPKAN